jgi:predicted nucleotidyltransferase
MTKVVEDHKSEISRLCESFGVRRLEVFGSAAEGGYDDSHSDVDFVVEFFPGQDLGPWLSNYQDLKDALEDLLNKEVDLVMAGAMRNPHFLAEVNRTRHVIYES